MGVRPFGAVVAAHHQGVLPAQVAHHLGGVGDGGAGGNDGGRAAARPFGQAQQAALGQAQQAAQHPGHVRPKDAPVGVHFVHHHVAQTLKEGVPGLVVRQDPLVQHVRVGQDHLGVAAGAGAFIARGIAVVKRHRDGGIGHQLVQAAQLVLGQGFGGEEHNRPGAGLAQASVQHGHLVSQSTGTW